MKREELGLRDDDYFHLSHDFHLQITQHTHSHAHKCIATPSEKEIKQKKRKKNTKKLSAVAIEIKKRKDTKKKRNQTSTDVCIVNGDSTIATIIYSLVTVKSFINGYFMLENKTNRQTTKQQNNYNKARIITISTIR